MLEGDQGAVASRTTVTEGVTSAYSPQTGLLYIPHQNLCMDNEGVEVSYIAGTPYVGANVKMYAGPAAIAANTRRGTRSAAKRCGRSRSNSPCGAAPW